MGGGGGGGGDDTWNNALYLRQVVVWALSQVKGKLVTVGGIDRQTRHLMARLPMKCSYEFDEVTQSWKQ